MGNRQLGVLILGIIIGFGIARLKDHFPVTFLDNSSEFAIVHCDLSTAALLSKLLKYQVEGETDRLSKGLSTFIVKSLSSSLRSTFDLKQLRNTVGADWRWVQKYLYEEKTDLVPVQYYDDARKMLNILIDEDVEAPVNS